MSTKECFDYLSLHYKDILEESKIISIKKDFLYFGKGQIEMIFSISIKLKNKWITNSHYCKNFEECLLEIELRLNEIKFGSDGCGCHPELVSGSIKTPKRVRGDGSAHNSD